MRLEAAGADAGRASPRTGSIGRWRCRTSASCASCSATLPTCWRMNEGRPRGYGSRPASSRQPPRLPRRQSDGGAAGGAPWRPGRRPADRGGTRLPRHAARHLRHRAGRRWDWRRRRFRHPDALSAAWRDVLRSMGYGDVGQADLPEMTATEPSPAHVFAIGRSPCDRVMRWEAARIAIRAHSDAPISHDRMDRATDLDRDPLGAAMEAAARNRHPLGFLPGRGPSVRPSCGREAPGRRRSITISTAPLGGPLKVLRTKWLRMMERRPGPVVRAPRNPALLPGRVRSWSREACAHGAEAVRRFRWLRFPGAQESRHAGLLRPDPTEATGPYGGRGRRPRAALAQALGAVFDYDHNSVAMGVGGAAAGAGFDRFTLAFASAGCCARLACRSRSCRRTR